VNGSQGPHKPGCPVLVFGVAGHWSMNRCTCNDPESIETTLSRIESKLDFLLKRTGPQQPEVQT